MEKKRSDDLVSFNRELLDLDLDEVSVEELERRLELGLVLPFSAMESCTTNSCNTYGSNPTGDCTDCNNNSCQTYCT